MIMTDSDRHAFGGSRGRWSALAAGLCALAVPGLAVANNGLQMIGFGAESVGMGGADTAVARDTTALNTNPAGITQLRGPAFDGYAALAYAVDVGHSDALGNDRQVSNTFIPAGGFGYTAPIGERLVAGIGLFAQGGAGNVYQDLTTPFGNADRLSAQIGFARISPAVAWRANDRLSVAFSLPVAAISAQQQAFPNTSVYNAANPAQSFFGLSLKDARGAGVGAKLGVMWRAGPALQFGATLASRTRLTARNGSAEVNFSAIGLGVVSYGDAKLEGFALPAEAAVGAAWQATPQTLLSFKVAYLDWSSALRSTTVTLSQPSSPLAPQTLTQSAAIDARNQTVLAMGVAHAADERLTLYGGINYGRNPIPAQNLTPLIAAIGELHLTGGFAWRLQGGWIASAALEYLVPKSVSYDNPAFPLGQSEERLSYAALHLMLGRRW